LEYLNQPCEGARDKASRGFDKDRSSNLDGGEFYHIPTPTPEIDKKN